MPWWGWLLIGGGIGALVVLVYFWKLAWDMWSGM